MVVNFKYKISSHFICTTRLVVNYSDYKFTIKDGRYTNIRIVIDGFDYFQKSERDYIFINENITCCWVGEKL